MEILFIVPVLLLLLWTGCYLSSLTERRFNRMLYLLDRATQWGRVWDRLKGRSGGYPDIKGPGIRIRNFGTRTVDNTGLEVRMADGEYLVTDGIFFSRRGNRLTGEGRWMEQKGKEWFLDDGRRFVRIDGKLVNGMDVWAQVWSDTDAEQVLIRELLRKA